MKFNQLTQAKIARAKPREREYTLIDGAGLMLMVHPNGGRYWRFRYSFQGRPKKISCGTFPAVSLSEARKKRDKLRGQVEEGIDPAAKKRAQRESMNTSRFETYAEGWIGRYMETVGERTRKLRRDRLVKWVHPVIGKSPVSAITRLKLLKLLQRIENAGFGETAYRVRGDLDRIFETAVTEELIPSNPVPPASVLKPKAKTKGFAAITDAKGFGKLLRDIDGYSGNVIVRYALRFLALTAVRPGELRNARWEEIDFHKQTWTIPAERMKMDRDHVVPLSSQAMEILFSLWGKTGKGRALKSLSWRGKKKIPSNPKARKGDYIFTIDGHKPLSENTLNTALRGIGYDGKTHTAHGFRKSFSTILNEKGFNQRDIELCLAHADENQVRGIYNKAERIKPRRKIMQKWADTWYPRQDDPL